MAFHLEFCISCQQLELDLFCNLKPFGLTGANLKIYPQDALCAYYKDCTKNLLPDLSYNYDLCGI